jgi:nucleoside-diphosphate-sugar epimerase
MKIVLTGKNSFIGKSFIDEYSKKYQIDESCTLANKIEDIKFDSVDVVIHLAAIVHQDKRIGEDIYFKINSDLAYSVAKKAKESGVSQFIFFSTVKVFGENTTKDEEWNENSECKPCDPYGRSKFDAEQRISSLNDETFSVSIIRPSVVYGPGVKGNIFKMIEIIEKVPILPFGNINNNRSMVYIKNLIALMAAIIDKRARGTFIACDSKIISTSQFVRILANISNKKRLIIPIPTFSQTIIKLISNQKYNKVFGSLCVNNSITCDILKYTPKYSLEEGLRDTYTWYKNR